MHIHYLGLQPYHEALKIMESLHAEIATNPEQEGVILVTAHPPTVTMGKQDLQTDLLVSPEQLKRQGIEYCKIDRGGSVTVHEPGQVVIYPVFHLPRQKQTVRSYVCLLEQAMIDTCAHFGVTAARDAINPGVWVKEKKIGALGIRIANKVTKHGIAFNVNNTLDTFSHIVPCGLHGRGVTSLQREYERSGKSGTLDYAQVEKFLAEKIKEKLCV